MPGLAANALSPDVGTNVSEFYCRRAQGFLGLSASRANWRFEDFFSGGQFELILSAPATFNAQPSQDGGQLSLTGGDGVSLGIAECVSRRTNSQAPIHVANIKTSKWYCVMRFKITVNPPSGGQMVGMSPFSFDATAGVYGTTSTTKYSFTTTNTTILSTVSIDTAMHVVEVWNDTANVYLSVDSEKPVSGAVTNLATSADEFELYVRAGAVVPAQTGIFDFFGIMTGQGS